MIPLEDILCLIVRKFLKILGGKVKKRYLQAEKERIIIMANCPQRRYYRVLSNSILGIMNSPKKSSRKLKGA